MAFDFYRSKKKIEKNKGQTELTRVFRTDAGSLSLKSHLLKTVNTYYKLALPLGAHSNF